MTPSTNMTHTANESDVTQTTARPLHHSVVAGIVGNIQEIVDATLVKEEGVQSLTVVLKKHVGVEANLKYAIRK